MAVYKVNKHLDKKLPKFNITTSIRILKRLTKFNVTTSIRILKYLNVN